VKCRSLIALGLLVVGGVACGTLLGARETADGAVDGGVDGHADDGRNAGDGGDAGDAGDQADSPPFLSCLGMDSVCGASGKEDCCASSIVDSGDFDRGDDAGYRASVTSFRLDDYEITVGRFRRFVNAVVGGYRPAAGSGKHAHLNHGYGLSWPGGYEPGWDSAWNSNLYADKEAWEGPSVLSCKENFATWTPSSASNETLPINCVNWFQAYAFCIWDGGFLPSEAEWSYAAAGGSEQRAFAWGDAGVGPDAGLAAYGCWYHGDGIPCSGVANIAPVGTLTAGNGRWHQSDLSGNLWEWNLDWYAEAYQPGCIDCAYLTEGTERVRRGGSYGFPEVWLLASTRSQGEPAYANPSVGARCARSP
jgi:formylglycine-generating enzyme required for sulfatase activity